MKSEKFRIVYEFDGKALSMNGGGDGVPAIMPARAMAQIAAEALNALLPAAEPNCSCAHCALLRLTRDTLRASAKITRRVGEEPRVLREN